MNISIIGTGYVGLVTGACFAEFGVTVTCMDTNPHRIHQLQSGELPFYEPGLLELVKKNVQENRLRFTSDLQEAVDQALAIFIAVGTPSADDGSADLSAVEHVAKSIGASMSGYKVIVTKSTVPVGTATRIRDWIQESQSVPCRFDVVSNPEFLREGSAIEDCLHPNRVIIGTDSPQAMAIMKDLYRPLYLIETPIVLTTTQTAELIKYASNAFLATKISFINEIATLCERVQADVQVVAKGMGLDNRIGSKFLHAGAGFGGSCFGKDTAALIHLGESVASPMCITRATRQVNDLQRQHMVEKIQSVLGDLSGKTIGFLGLSFKPNTNDIRDSPALAIAEALLKQGATVQGFDPEALEEACLSLPTLRPCQDSYDAADQADALVLATEWNQFRNLDLTRIKSLLRQPVIVDLRNIYDPQKLQHLGFDYLSVGRPPVNRGPAEEGPIHSQESLVEVSSS
ncbi:MAG: UDP-glucose/GDP-mannose dehydrogenase family protein [Nitrospirota bacterium]|nr:UDP-glucose/GDP-mannose dehydrogenase family protein [Nitrospirota bacterium]